MVNQRYQIFMAAVLATAVVVFPSSVYAQDGRLSLAERVARMEQQLQGQQGGATLEQLNRINELQTEVQELRGVVEQQQFEIENLKKRARDQFVDLDSRVSRMGGAAGAGSAQSAAEAAEAGQPPYATEPQEGFQDVAPVVDPYAPPKGAPIETRDRRPPSNAIEVAPVPPPPGGVAGVGEKAEYDAARALLDAGQYASAARAFAEFVRKNPNGELTANALYWLGESYYVTQNFQVALDTFRDLIARFPDSNKVADAMLKVGYCHFELQQFDDAEIALNEVISRYPDTTVARLAQGRLRALQTDRGSR